MSNTSAKLDYPVALITADEMAMAGGVVDTANTNYYLYNGQYQWTLSPGDFDSNDSDADFWSVHPSGNLNPWYNVTNSFGVRPVINLRPDVKISSGDGTSIAPFKIKE